MTLKMLLSKILFSSVSIITGKSNNNSLENIFYFWEGVKLYLLKLDQRPSRGWQMNMKHYKTDEWHPRSE